jgi:hypothetical protein
MHTLKASLAFLIVPLLVFACSSTKWAEKAPSFRVTDMTLAKGIDVTGPRDILLDPTDTFSILDAEIISHIAFENLSGKHKVKWEWYDPNGDLYYSTGNHPLEASEGKYIEEGSAWHTISVRGEKAMEYPGDWKVALSLDNHLLASRAFAITPVVAQRKSYAVIVGISRYRSAGQSGLTTLPFAGDDARDFRDSLLTLGWEPDHIRCLTNQEATLRDVMISLGSWLTKAGPDDLIVLYWSGHGFPDPEDPEKVYFACYDTDPRIPVTGYRMDQVIAALAERGAQNVVVLADTCHAGKLITRGDKGISIRPYVEKLKREKTVPKGWIYMVAADTDRQAIEHSSWSNGAFTYCLLKALSGAADGFESVGPKDGVVTMAELRAYMESVMPDETQRILGTAIRPIITTSTGDPEIWNLTLQMR